MLMMIPRTGAYNLSKAIDIAKQMQDSDPDFKYVVEDCKNGLGRIDVYDEENELVQQGFII